jgi:hypothetical protein
LTAAADIAIRQYDQSSHQNKTNQHKHQQPAFLKLSQQPHQNTTTTGAKRAAPTETDKMLLQSMTKYQLTRSANSTREKTRCETVPAGRPDLKQLSAPDWTTVVRRAAPLIAPPPCLSTSHKEDLDWGADLKKN